MKEYIYFFELVLCFSHERGWYASMKLKLNAELSACAHFLENFCSEAIVSNHPSYPSLKFPIQVNPLGTSALFPMASSNLEAPSQRLERFGRLAAGHIKKNLSEMEKSKVKPYLVLHSQKLIQRKNLSWRRSTHDSQQVPCKSLLTDNIDCRSFLLRAFLIVKSTW